MLQNKFVQFYYFRGEKVLLKVQLKALTPESTLIVLYASGKAQTK